MPSIGGKGAKKKRSSTPTRNANGDALSGEDEIIHLRKLVRIAEREAGLLRERLSYVDEKKVDLPCCYSLLI